MLYLTEDYQKNLYSHWNNYILDNKSIPLSANGIRPMVYESWKRSKSYGVDPLNVLNKSLDAAALTRVLKNSQPLISVAHSYITNLYSYVQGSNFVIVLADREGYVIDMIGKDKSIQSSAKKTGLEIGTSRSEKHVGTASIGTCLATMQPLQIYGCEHYLKPHHQYFSAAAPIKNHNGVLIGCLALIGPNEYANEHTLGMVCAAVDGLEKEMKVRQAYEDISHVNNQLFSTIQSISSGIIMIDGMGIITHHNSRASQFLKVPSQDLVHENIANLIDLKKASINPVDLTSNIHNKELTYVNYLGNILHLSLSASIIYSNENNIKSSTVLVFEEQQQIHKMISKMSGFSANYTFDSIIGNSLPFTKAISMGKVAAQSASNVLILGESGTGKELFAQSIHNASSRSNGPFVAINCASLPKGLIESELFGYEGGAFTGANKEGRPGKFELAAGGTIFLDEIGDMPLDLQTSLLRVIQSREIIRVGGKQPKKINVRIMAATNLNLMEAVTNKTFRSDLFYRLNVLSVELPSLRERREDIPVLANYFIGNYNKSMGKSIKEISPEALQLMVSYSWPGNVRELENVIERSMNLAQTDAIMETDLPESLASDIHSSDKTAPPLTASPNESTSRGREYGRILEALRAEEGNITNVSLALNIPKRTLYRKLQKYNIDINSYRL